MNFVPSRLLTAFLANVLSCLVLISQAQPDGSSDNSGVEGLPIISYDTDTGFGYGAKLFALNSIGIRESFDLVLFNSTKGERWYRVVFSLPDFEMRQGTVYPLGLDLTIDYDKWISNSYFGVGNTSSFSHREFYTKEPIELSLLFSRGVTRTFVIQAGMKYRAVRNFDFSQDSRLAHTEPALNASRVVYSSFLFTGRYDNRDSYVNPTDGLVISGETEFAPEFAFNNVTFSRFSVCVQRYTPLPEISSVLALRLGLQGLSGGDLPVQVLLPVGGNNTLRGSPQDRYLDKTAGLLNLELRFPIYWRFGGVVGTDAGKVWGSISKLDLSCWATNPVAGLRLYMNTFVVRLDVGFGKEATGFYLNFGQIF